MNKADLLRIGREVLKPSDSGDVVEWLEDNVHAIPDSPMPGPFRSDRTPWIAEALRIAADPETRLLTVLASIQSGKSLFARLLTCHIVANAPGPTMLLQATDPEAKDFALRYLRPVWNNCPPVKARLSLEDLDRSTTADSMASMSRATSSARANQATPGARAMASRRLDSMRTTNSSPPQRKT